MYDPQRIFGVTTLDVVRSNTFIAEAKVINPMLILLIHVQFQGPDGMYPHHLHKNLMNVIIFSCSGFGCEPSVLPSSGWSFRRDHCAPDLSVHASRLLPCCEWLFPLTAAFLTHCIDFKFLFAQEEREKLTRRIQNAGTEVVEAKAGGVSLPS